MRGFTKLAIVTMVGAVTVIGLLRAGAAEKQEKTFILRPIGQVKVEGDRASVVLDKAYEPGLLGLEGWSHIHVVWWFDKNDTPQRRAMLQVHPRGDQNNPLQGVFATRSPVRPNLIAMSICKIIAIKENIIEIEKIDAFDGTPVLDIKPYTPGPDNVQNAKVPAWARPR